MGSNVSRARVKLTSNIEDILWLLAQVIQRAYQGTYLVPLIGLGIGLHSLLELVVVDLSVVDLIDSFEGNLRTDLAWCLLLAVGLFLFLFEQCHNLSCYV